jgi:hypothetical protein
MSRRVILCDIHDFRVQRVFSAFDLWGGRIGDGYTHLAVAVGAGHGGGAVSEDVARVSGIPRVTRRTECAL